MKYKIVSVSIAVILTVAVVLSFTLPSMLAAKAPRYHEHLSAEEKKECTDHGDDVFCSHLPVISIDAGGTEIPGRAYYDDEGNRYYTTTADGGTYVIADVNIVDNEGKMNHLTDGAAVSASARVRVRGYSSRYFIKLGYAVTFVDDTGANEQHEVMGMDSHHEWVMHGPILDKTLIRNYMWYNIAGEIMDYAPNVRFCEAYINGEYMGLYLMVESITAGDNCRLQLSINKKQNTFTGYCLRVDRGSTELKTMDTFSMYTYQNPSIVDSVYPGAANLTPELKESIQNDFSGFERLLYSTDYNDEKYGYASMIDVDSFIDYFIINEFTSNYDAGMYSTYIYKEVNSPYKLCIWDFNSACDNYQEYIVDPEMFYMQNGVWYSALFKDGAFTEKLIARYHELRKTYLNEEYLDRYIDETIAYLGDAIDRNFERWDDAFIYDLLLPYERNPDTYEEAVTDLKDFIHVRGEWMDENIDTLRQYIVDPKE
ncbi:MAG: CotH kinase family protein [Clostridia bacterium]|nr:CotH kinase family protein [Clostridia bacterium]